MTQFPRRPRQHFSKRAVSWALLSQSIWLPVLFSTSQDYFQSKTSDYDFTSISTIPNQYSPSPLKPSETKQHYESLALQSLRPVQSQTTIGIVLNSTSSKAYSLQSRVVNSSQNRLLNSAFFSPGYQTTDTIARLDHMKHGLINATGPSAVAGPQRTFPFLRTLFTPADLLGGPLTLRDSNEPLMPPIARAERAQSMRKGDPLSPVPSSLRDPMRRALNVLSLNSNEDGVELPGQSDRLTLEQARIVHVPSFKVSRSSEVPLALQADGSVDILNTPDDPAVVDEIKSWSTRQQLPAKGRMTPILVHLHPLPASETSSTQSRSSAGNHSVQVIDSGQADSSRSSIASDPPSSSVSPQPVQQSHPISSTHSQPLLESKAPSPAVMSLDSVSDSSLNNDSEVLK